MTSANALAALELPLEGGVKQLGAEQGAGMTQSPRHSADKEKGQRWRTSQPGQGD